MIPRFVWRQCLGYLIIFISFLTNIHNWWCLIQGDHKVQIYFVTTQNHQQLFSSSNPVIIFLNHFSNFSIVFEVTLLSQLLILSSKWHCYHSFWYCLRSDTAVTASDIVFEVTLLSQLLILSSKWHCCHSFWWVTNCVLLNSKIYSSYYFNTNHYEFMGILYVRRIRFELTFV